MPHQPDTAFAPVKSWIENHIDESGDGSESDATLPSIHALLRAGQSRIFIDRQRGVESAVFFPIVVVGVVIVMMPRPHILGHPRDHAQGKPEDAIESLAAKQAAVTTFVHQRKKPHAEKAD